MAGHLLLRTAQKLPKNSAACFAHHAAAVPGVDPKLANREVVGFGFNGGANYHDRVDFPMPAIRFKPVTPDIKVLLIRFKNISVYVCVREREREREIHEVSSLVFLGEKFNYIIKIHITVYSFCF